jgi:hypothetical protein
MPVRVKKTRPDKRLLDRLSAVEDDRQPEDYRSVFALERLAHRPANFTDGNEREHGKDGKSCHHRATS